MIWWLLSPFVGRDLGQAAAELETKTVDSVIERCAYLAHQNEMAARLAVQQRTIELARSGYFGSTIPDTVRIAELEQKVSALQAAVDAATGST